MRSVIELSVEDWVRERLDNCQRIAAGKTGADRDGWLEDAEYFSRVLAMITAAPSAIAKPGWKLMQVSQHEAKSLDREGEWLRSKDGREAR